MTNQFRQPEALWKVSFPFKFSQLETFENYFANLTDSMSSHELSSKTVESMPEDLWSFEGYFETKPDLESIRADLKIIAKDWDYGAELGLKKMENIDWVAQMQRDFEPIAIGQFFITNPSHEILCPPQMKKIVMESSRAFGTGEHSTTQGCLEAMESLKDLNPTTVYDIGTGTGILAIGAAKLWPSARVIGTDIEEVAIEVAKLHAASNGVDIEFIVSDSLPQGGKVDLIISNILKNPLINFAPSFAEKLASGGAIILSGFLENQQEEVEKAYLEVGLRRLSLLNKEGWISLTLAKAP